MLILSLPTCEVEVNVKTVYVRDAAHPFLGKARDLASQVETNAAIASLYDILSR